MTAAAENAFLETCTEVVIRFKAHGTYKTEAGALKALARRTPGHTTEEYRAAFTEWCAVYDRAVAAIERHRAPSPNPRERRIAEPGDIDQQACLAELDEITSGAAARKRQILDWVIYWHYLK